MKLTEFGDKALLVRDYDKAMGAKSYGSGIGTIQYAAECLPKEEQELLSKELARLIDAATTRTIKALKDAGIEVDGKYPENVASFRQAGRVTNQAKGQP